MHQHAADFGALGGSHRRESFQPVGIMGWRAQIRARHLMQLIFGRLDRFFGPGMLAQFVRRDFAHEVRRDAAIFAACQHRRDHVVKVKHAPSAIRSAGS